MSFTKVRNIIQVPVGSSHVPSVLDDDAQPRVVIRPAIETLGLDYSGAMQRLKRRSWATVGMTPIVAEDGKLRDMTTVSIQTWVMFLATVDERRVREDLRPMLVEFQRESMEALTDYWTKGVAVNHRATEEQLRREFESALQAKDKQLKTVIHNANVRQRMTDQEVEGLLAEASQKANAIWHAAVKAGVKPERLPIP